MITILHRDDGRGMLVGMILSYPIYLIPTGGNSILGITTSLPHCTSFLSGAGHGQTALEPIGLPLQCPQTTLDKRLVGERFV